MKLNIIIKMFCITASCIVLLHQLNLPAYADPIKLATQREGHRLSAESAPFVKCAMNMINQPYLIDKIPWERAQKDTEDGINDGFFIATKNKKRDSYAVFAEPIYTIRWLYIVNKDSGIAPGNTDFNTRLFCADIGSARYKWLDAKYSKGEISNEITAVDLPEQMLKMLKANRIDVAVINAHGFDTALKKLSLPPDTFKTFLMREIPAGIYFNKKFLNNTPDFIEKFNNALKRCKKMKQQ
ncbi:ABC transporter substrate-binding protein [Desulfobacterales bacterium HSG17]|nr:ABC transporter substrate-binding protein [Desulfobacterales bacterium HSG17]